MESNTHSTEGPRPDGLATVASGLDQLAAQDLDRLPDPVRAERVLALRELAGVDGRGAAGAERDQQVGSTAAWLGGRLRLGEGAASSAVRTARALFRGPLAGTGQAVCAGELSPAHARVLAQGTRAASSGDRRRRGDPAGGWPAPGSRSAAAGRRRPVAGRRPRWGRGGPGAAPWAAGAVADPDPGP